MVELWDCLKCQKYLTDNDAGWLSLSSQPGYPTQTEAGADVPGRCPVPGEVLPPPPLPPAPGQHRLVSTCLARNLPQTGRATDSRHPLWTRVPVWREEQNISIYLVISNKSASLGLFGHDHETEILTLCINWRTDRKYSKSTTWYTLRLSVCCQPGIPAK